MTCSDFVEQLLDYDTKTAEERGVIDQHLAGCEACQAYRTALGEVDVWLDRELPSIQTSPVFANNVRSRIQALEAAIRKPSFVPQFLDLVGSFSVAVALIAALISLFPNFTKSEVVVGVECLAILMAIGFAIKVYADMRLDSKS